MKRRFNLRITGIVQGVGFRPFIYKLAGDHGLTGWVLNDSQGVELEIQGEEESCKTFLESITAKKPEISVIEELIDKEVPVSTGEENFIIKPSRKSASEFVLISPDLATCPDCTSELMDPDDRRFRYPFINCTNCGPRFTIIQDIPYDREKTTMSEFPMCPDCSSEYSDPGDRRFHAQPNACPACGPELTLLDNDGTEFDTESDLIKITVDLLRKGKIVAIKGLGGYHLACDAMNPEAVSELRSRKYREDKPFALMFPGIESIRDQCFVSEEEQRLLTNEIKPIMLLKKKSGCSIPEQVAPGQNYLGAMLPYTPIHLLLLNDFNGPLVMTSGNISDEPISYKDPEAEDRLSKIADYFLVHNREIYIRNDDSVVREFKGAPYLIRRARGYVPFPVLLPLDSEIPVLATGGMLKNTFCLTRDKYAFVSHHIGDLDNLETLRSFSEGIEHFKKLFSIHPEVVVYDKHPGYLSTRWALESGIKNSFGVQHHYAHVLSCLADNRFSGGKVIGVCCDGTGYGDDGSIWGCEFLVTDYTGYNRAGHLLPFNLPGGDSAILNPYKTGISLLKEAGFKNNEINNLIFKDLAEELEIIENMLSEEINTVKTSSLGRLFDGVSSILGIRERINYEAQAAIELEMLADLSTEKIYPYEIKENNGIFKIDFRDMIKQIVSDRTSERPASEVAGKFHNTVIDFLFSTIQKISEKTGLKTVALTGGVFQNIIILNQLYNRLTGAGYSVLIHRNVPANDGGLSLGQAVFGIINSRKEI